MLKRKHIQFYSTQDIAEKVADSRCAEAVMLDGLWAIRRGDDTKGFSWLMLNGLFQKCKIGISR